MIKRVSITLGLLLIVFFLTSTPVYAINGCPVGQFGVLCTMNGGDNTTVVRNIFNIMFVAAVLLSLAFLLIGGIRWVTSGGDKAKVDSARGTITGAIVGLIVTFSSFMILSLVNYFFGIGAGQRGTIFVIPQINSTIPNYPINAPVGGSPSTPTPAAFVPGQSN